MTDKKVTDLAAFTTPTDDDLLMAVDAPGTTPASKKITWANIKATLKAYFDAIYAIEGTYTPALTNSTNIASSTAAVTNYERNGNTVKVWGNVTIDPTATGAIDMGMALPIASSIGATSAVAGVFGQWTTASNVGFIIGDVSNNRARFLMNAVDAASRAYQFSFVYKVI